MKTKFGSTSRDRLHKLNKNNNPTTSIYERYANISSGAAAARAITKDMQNLNKFKQDANSDIRQVYDHQNQANSKSGSTLLIQTAGVQSPIRKSVI